MGASSNRERGLVRRIRETQKIRRPISESIIETQPRGLGRPRPCQRAGVDVLRNPQQSDQREHDQQRQQHHEHKARAQRSSAGARIPGNRQLHGASAAVLH